MRFRVILEPPEPQCTIPINYNSVVSQFVYEMLQPDVPFSTQTASTGAGDGILYYTFSNLFIPNVELAGRHLRFGKVEIELLVSLLAPPEQEREVMARMKEIQDIDFSNGAPSEQRELGCVNVKRIELVSEIAGFGSRARFRMLSPLATPVEETDRGTRYLHYTHGEFSEALRATLLAKYERWKGALPEDTNFAFHLDPLYLQRRRGRISKLVTFNELQENERRIKALVSPFEVEGNPELIWLGYVAGFGERNILGFGCAEPVSVASRVEGVTAQRAPAPKSDPEVHQN